MIRHITNKKSYLFTNTTSAGFSSKKRIERVFQFIRRWLNRISFEENRTFESRTQSKQIVEKPVPKNQLEAEEVFKQGQKQLSQFQENRLKRIDDILGTHTYFHQSKLYQERLDSEHLMDIQLLKVKHKDTPRKQLDMINPQILPKFKTIGKKKHLKEMQKLSTYPQVNPGLITFKDQQDPQLVVFLGKEALYTKLALSEMDFTLESLDNEIVQVENNPRVIGKYVYFKPSSLLSFYRVDKVHYTKELQESVFKLSEMAQFCEQVFSIEQIYECLKQFDYDERVSEYIGKIQNNTLLYMISDMFVSPDQSQVCLCIDLLGTKKQYCLMYKNLSAAGEQGKFKTENVIFNVQPSVAMRKNTAYYVQRNQESQYRQLIEQNFFEKSSTLIYTCPSHYEISLHQNINHTIFVEQKELHVKVNNKINLLTSQNELILLNKPENTQKLTEDKAQYHYKCQEVIGKGFIVIRQNLCQPSDYMKYSQNQSYSHFISLIPFKKSSFLLDIANSLSENSQNIQKQIKQVKKNPSQNLDFLAQYIIFQCKEQQFISDIKVFNVQPQPYLLLNISLQSVYNKNKLYIHPFKEKTKPYSLFLDGFPIQLNYKENYNLSENSTNFFVKSPFIKTEFSYTFWKKELQQLKVNDRVYTQTMTISQENLKIRVICSKVFVSQKVPVVLYIPSRNEEVDEVAMKKVLQKGIMFVQILNCRGSFGEDALTLLQGCQKNYHNYLEDIKTTVEFIGENLSEDISLYAKGGSSCFLALLLNIQYPSLFASTVLHNGVYDLGKVTQNIEKFRQFFGESQENIQMWKEVNPLLIPFQKQVKEDIKTIGSLKKIMFSSEPGNREESRKLVYKLRMNRKLEYQTVFLKEHNEDYEVDLYNFAFLCFQLKQRQKKR